MVQKTGANNQTKRRRLPVAPRRGGLLRTRASREKPTECARDAAGRRNGMSPRETPSSGYQSGLDTTLYSTGMSPLEGETLLVRVG